VGICWTIAVALGFLEDDNVGGSDADDADADADDDADDDGDDDDDDDIGGFDDERDKL
jgi:hypothetical protein